jgi:DNA repair ATPase RecN
MPMGTDELIAELNLLMERFDTQPEDLHEVHFRVVELMNQLRAMGESVPEDLKRFADELEEEVERVNAAPGS